MRGGQRHPASIPRASKNNNKNKCSADELRCITKAAAAGASVPRTHHDEGPLHPSLPLFGLVPAEELDAAAGAAVFVVLQGAQGGDEEGAVHDPEHGGGVVVVPRVARLPPIPNVRQKQHDRDLRLRPAEFRPALPLLQHDVHHGVRHSCREFIATRLGGGGVLVQWMLEPNVVLFFEGNHENCCCCFYCWT
jgi:hypothetical protein